MKRSLDHIGEISVFAALVTLSLGATCWAGPPGPPVIPSTPVGNLGTSALTIAAMAAYGYWKARK